MNRSLAGLLTVSISIVILCLGIYYDQWLFIGYGVGSLLITQLNAYSMWVTPDRDNLFEQKGKPNGPNK